MKFIPVSFQTKACLSTGLFRNIDSILNFHFTTLKCQVLTWPYLKNNK